MLKTELSIVLILILLFDGEVPKYIAIILAFLAGLSISTGSEWYKGTFTKKRFVIRLLYVFGLAVMGMFIWQDYSIKTNIVYFMFVITLFSDLIVTLVFKAGEFLIRKYFNDFQNKQ